MSLVSKLYLIFTCFFFFETTKSLAQIKGKFKCKLDSIISSETVRPFSGVVLISKNSKIIYARAHGYPNLSKQLPITLNDKFVLLSNSKQITAVLVLQEVDKKHIRLQSSIKTYLPELKQSWADSVTIHNLLNNTSGIMAMDKPLAFRPGTKFNYSNLNYILLGKILESTSKKKLEEQFNLLFETCGMKDSFFPSGGNKNGIVHSRQYLIDGTVKEVRDVRIPPEFVPAGGIVSTVDDLAQWNKCLHSGKLLKRDSYKAMTTYTIKSQHNVFGKKEIGYGYGIRIDDSKHLPEYGHTGIIPQLGFTSLNIYYPTTKTSLIILENQAYDNFDIAYYFETQIRELLREEQIR
jgi:D-alanyl-D-alanine carboxypeptidase